jgi:chromosome segregation ATPase
MATELSFAQALNEARQIIVQQSNRIKADLDRIKSMQETVTGQTATIAEQDRALHLRSSEIEELTGQVRELTAKLDATRTAKDQAEAVCDRQGQRLTQLQESVATLERQASESADRIAEMTEELTAARGQLPTSEDNEALVALATLLATKKGGTPAQAAPRMAA